MSPTTKHAAEQPPEAVIDIRGLSKSYGKFRALNALDLTVTRGEVMAFLGPNGAGKSTTIRILLGLLKADFGEVTLLGQDPWRDVVALHRRLAYVPGDVSLWPSLTGGQAIDLLGNLRGGVDQGRVTELLEKFELDPTKRGHQYSKGNRQKVAIVAALAADVELLILDEPTSGLDPLMEAVFQAEIRAQKDKGTTILLSSHIMSEAEALADRVAIIRDGTIVEAGTIEQLRAHTSITIKATLERPPANLAELDFLHSPSARGATITGHVDRTGLTEAMGTLALYGLTNLTVSEPSLEDLFLSQYGELNSGDTNPGNAHA